MQDEIPYTGYVSATKIKGVDGEIITYIAEKLGLKLKINRTDWAGGLASAQQCRVDGLVGPAGWTKERAAAGIFTDPTYYTDGAHVTSSWPPAGTFSWPWTKGTDHAHDNRLESLLVPVEGHRSLDGWSARVSSTLT